MCIVNYTLRKDDIDDLTVHREGITLSTAMFSDLVCWSILFIIALLRSDWSRMDRSRGICSRAINTLAAARCPRSQSNAVTTWLLMESSK
jgi:hypothetical protein